MEEGELETIELIDTDKLPDGDTDGD